MAKTSKIAKNEQRRRTVARYAERRAALKDNDPPTGTAEQRAAAVAHLQRASARRQPGTAT